jgi:hypothetical protein
MVRAITLPLYLAVSDLVIRLTANLYFVNPTTLALRKHAALILASPTYEVYLTPKRHDCQRYHYLSLTPHERCAPRSQVHGQEP